MKLKNTLLANALAILTGVDALISSIDNNSVSWPNQAQQDIVTAYNQLKDNHPGYYDTENIQWKSLLETQYEKHLVQASEVSSYDKYKAIMKSFVRSMHDVHLEIQFTDADRMATYQPIETASISEFLPNGAWVRLPSFDCKSSEEISSMQAVIQKIAEYKNHQTIVLDVRGNGGGSSEWGIQLLKQLFSRQYVDEQISLLAHKKPVYAEWRASKDNIDYMKSWITPANIYALNLQDIVELIQNTIKGCELALAKNMPFFKEMPEDCAYQETDKRFANPVTAKIILLTDGTCCSSCLDFIDLLFLITPVIHVGHATNADTAYMECRSVLLPSQRASLTFPMKVYRNRIRKPYQKYYPAHTFTGDIHNTQALQDWIILFFA
jgi:hypothetical protein